MVFHVALRPLYMKAAKKSHNKIDPNESPTAWFFALETALARGDWRRAADAERELKRLGVDVRFRRARDLARRPARTAPTPKPPRGPRAILFGVAAA